MFVRILVLFGAATAAVVAGWNERALAGWMQPAGSVQSAPSPYVTASPSPDGRWVAIQRVSPAEQTGTLRIVDRRTGESRAVAIENPRCVPNAWSEDGLLRVRTSTEKRVVEWIDPRTFRSVKTTPDGDWHAQGFADRSSDGWSTRGASRGEDGAKLETFAWTERGTVLARPASARHAYQTTKKSGVVFEIVTEDDARIVRRHDMTSGESRDVLRLARWTHVTASPDGERLLLVSIAGRAARTGRERARVLDARDGRVLEEFDAPCWCRWTGDGHRWILTEREGRTLLRDLERATSVELCGGDARLRVQPLEGGELLVQQDDEVTLRDAKTGQLIRRL
jgi:hypothetical protein